MIIQDIDLTSDEENEDLAVENAELKSQLAAMRAEQVKRESKYKKKIKQLMEKCKTKDKLLDIAKQDYIRLEKDYDEVHDSLMNARDSMAAVKDDLKEASKEIKSLQEELNDCDDRSAASNLKKAKKEIKALKKELEECEGELEVIDTNYDAIKMTLNTTRRSLSKSKSDVVSWQKKANEWIIRCQTEERKKRRALVELETAQGSLETAKRRARSMQEQIRSLENEPKKGYCSICTDDHCADYMVDCGHIFCYDCWMMHAEYQGTQPRGIIGGKVKCPMCNQRSEVIGRQVKMETNPDNSE